MSENKKSFVLYSDQRSIVEMLSNEQAGQLLKHIYSYVNDESPICDNPMVNLAFEPIKLQLIRDLEKWSKEKEERSYSGKLGNLKRYHEDLFLQVINNQINIEDAENIAKGRKLSHSDNTLSQRVANIADNVNDNVNVINNIASSEAPAKKINNIEERILKFADTLRPFIEKYGKETITDFYKYWKQPNKSNTKFKQELEKTWDVNLRLETWAKNEIKYGSKKEVVIDPRNPKNLPIIY